MNVSAPLIPVEVDEVAPSLLKTGGKLVGSPNTVVGVGKPSDPQDVEITAIVIKLVDRVDRGMIGVGSPSVPILVGIGTAETGVDEPSRPVVNEATALVE